MKHLLSGMVILVMFTTPVVAEMRYDRNLEQAAMAIVASNIGDIRGGFSYAQKLKLVVRPVEVEPMAKKIEQQATDDLSRGSSSQAGQSPSIATF